MNDDLIIGSILVDGQGWIQRGDGVIEPFLVGGEMGSITWYRKTFKDSTCNEYNGKYIIEICWIHKGGQP